MQPTDHQGRETKRSSVPPLKRLCLAVVFSLLGGLMVAAAPVGWAVLVQKESYQLLGMPDLKNGYIDLAAMQWLLADRGWPADHILVIKDPATPDDIQKGLAWLAENAKQDDIALFYFSGHGRYLRERIQWADTFPQAWAKIQSQNRCVLVDTCQAGEFVDALSGDNGPFLGIGAVAEGECGWGGDWREGLPIIGGVFTHYWVESMVDPVSDLDKDGRISVQEAALRAEIKQRKYMRDFVWADKTRFTVPSGKRDKGYPHVRILDALGHPLLINLKQVP